MSVLSDREIRELISSRNMILGAVDERIAACSYEFRPGIVVSTGRDVEERCVLNWTGQTGPTDIHSVKPGELVWVRTLEKVVMPDDICAFWWQTNRLSRQGLMLVNMSMIEPGYQGPLACLFVNFGNRPVTIDPDSVVAKLAFNRLGEATQKPLQFHPDDTSYDRSIVRAAMGTPVTFLDVGNIEVSLDLKRKEAISDIQTEKETVAKSLKEDVEDARKQARQQFENDANSLIRKVLGAAALGFVLVVAAMTFVPWLQSTVQPNLSSDIQQQVNSVIDQRLLLSGGIATTRQFQQLEGQVQTLERQLKQRSASAGGTP
jgi:deoxycytidine triphosphate deaminase